jgi:hypothetical protein
VSHRGGGTDRGVGMGAVATGRLDAALVVGYISVSPHACTRSSCLAPSKFTSPVGVGGSAMGCISSGQPFASRSLACNTCFKAVAITGTGEDWPCVLPDADLRTSSVVDSQSPGASCGLSRAQ